MKSSVVYFKEPMSKQLWRKMPEMLMVGLGIGLLVVGAVHVLVSLGMVSVGSFSLIGKWKKWWRW